MYTAQTQEPASARSIEYRVSLAGKLARKVIPWMQAALPPHVYRFVYDTLYAFYKSLGRVAYLRRVAAALVTGNRAAFRRSTLTHRLLPFTMGGSKALENAFDVTSMAEEKGIAGALVECGVAQGGTAAMMAMTNRIRGSHPRQKWFFDSYEGLPEPTEEDYQDGALGHFVRPLPRGSCLGTIEQVSDLLFGRLRFSREEIRLVKGWFQDTVPAQRDAVGPIAVLRLDGDWYESTKIPLDHFFDQITPGGFVIIDDYATCHGSRRATDEFIAERGLPVVLHEDGRGGIWFQKPGGTQ